MLGLADLKHTKIYQDLRQEVRAEALQEGEYKATVKSIARMLAHDFSIGEIAKILDLELNVVTDVAIGSLLKSELNAKQIAKRLELETGQVTLKAIRILLSEHKSEEQIAQQLGVTLATVRRVTRPKSQKPEAN